MRAGGRRTVAARLRAPIRRSSRACRRDSCCSTAPRFRTPTCPDTRRACPADGLHPLILGTAGHIDHGKTTLVAALTGVDTDRLPEEKRAASRSSSASRRWSSVGTAASASSTCRDTSLRPHDGRRRDRHRHRPARRRRRRRGDAADARAPRHPRLLGVGRGVVALTKRDLVDAERPRWSGRGERLLPGVPRRSRSPRHRRRDSTSCAPRSPARRRATARGATGRRGCRSTALHAEGYRHRGHRHAWSGAVRPGRPAGALAGGLDVRVRQRRGARPAGRRGGGRPAGGAGADGYGAETRGARPDPARRRDRCPGHTGWNAR